MCSLGLNILDDRFNILYYKLALHELLRSRLVCLLAKVSHDLLEEEQDSRFKAGDDALGLLLGQLLQYDDVVTCWVRQLPSRTLTCTLRTVLHERVLEYVEVLLLRQALAESLDFPCARDVAEV